MGWADKLRGEVQRPNEAFGGGHTLPGDIKPSFINFPLIAGITFGDPNPPAFVTKTKDCITVRTRETGTPGKISPSGSTVPAPKAVKIPAVVSPPNTTKPSMCAS